MIKKTSSNQPCGRDNEYMTGAFLKSFSIDKADNLSDLIWFQTVCQCYQQMSLVGKELSPYLHMYLCHDYILIIDSFNKCESKLPLTGYLCPVIPYRTRNLLGEIML